MAIFLGAMIQMLHIFNLNRIRFLGKLQFPGCASLLPLVCDITEIISRVLPLEIHGCIHHALLLLGHPGIAFVLVALEELPGWPFCSLLKPLEVT